MRDLIGYGWKYPKVEWPEGARVVVSLVLNYEEGSELCIGDGDTEGERVGEFVYPTMDSKTRGLGIESTFEYGSRVGTWRVLDLFDEFGVKSTIFACGRALERNPLVARAFTGRGHEVAGHGYRWVDHFRMEVDQEREQIALAVKAIADTTGERPVGWYCRYAPSVNTRRLLVEDGGFIYDCDSYADEVPYWVEQDGKPHLIVPYQFDANDAKFFRGPGWSGAGEFWEYLRDSVDCLLKEGRSNPKNAKRRTARSDHRSAWPEHSSLTLPRVLRRDTGRKHPTPRRHRKVVVQALSSVVSFASWKPEGAAQKDSVRRAWLSSASPTRTIKFGAGS